MIFTAMNNIECEESYRFSFHPLSDTAGDEGFESVTVLISNATIYYLNIDINSDHVIRMWLRGYQPDRLWQYAQPQSLFSALYSCVHYHCCSPHKARWFISNRDMKYLSLAHSLTPSTLFSFYFHITFRFRRRIRSPRIHFHKKAIYSSTKFFRTSKHRLAELK